MFRALSDYKHEARARWIIPILVLTAYFGLSLMSMRHKTITYDEDAHLRYGRRILAGNSDRFDDSKMPVSALNAIPQAVAPSIPLSALQYVLGKFVAARLATLIGSLFLGYLCFRWSKQLYGYVAGLFTLVLYVFEPNMIAHSQLVTTDLYATVMVALSAYALWRYSIHRDWKHAVLLAVILGMSQIAKYTSVLLYPMVAVILLLRDSPEWLGYVRDRAIGKLWHYAMQVGLLAILVGLTGILIINIGFLFNRTLQPTGSYKFRSDLFQSVQSRIVQIVDLPVPLPHPYLEGLDHVYYNDTTNFRGNGKYYLLGELRNKPFLGYYFVAFLYKVPIAIQVIFLSAIVRYMRGPRRQHFLHNELFLIGPVIFFSIYFNVFNHAQLGLRYFLLTFPFIFIFSGNLLVGWRKFTRKQAIPLTIGLAYLILSVLSYFPHYLAYFNELVPDRRLAYKVLADSNLDWGQSDWYLSQYIKANPDVVVEPQRLASGKFVVGVNRLVGIMADAEKFEWIRENFEPVDTIAYSYLIYQISPEDIEAIKRENQ